MRQAKAGSLRFRPFLCALFALSTADAASPPKHIQLADAALASTDEGRLRVRYLVGCALPPEIVVETERDGVRYEFPGDLGLAPAWSQRALSAEESRRVSACIQARSNYFGVEVKVSLRADGAMGGLLRPDPKEAREFLFFEGGFFGDIFQPDAPAFACSGAATPDRENRLRALKRLCTVPDGRVTAAGRPLTYCGFILAGPCATQPFRQNGVDYSGQVIQTWLEPISKPSERD